MKTDNIEMGQFADLFPGMKSMSTKDPRVFCTPWKKRHENGEPVKERKYFCCVVGKDCFGVDIIKPWATNSEVKEKEAFESVVFAADYYEANGSWPNMV